MNLPQHLPIHIGTAYRVKEDDQQWREDYTYDTRIIRSSPTRNAHPIMPPVGLDNSPLIYEVSGWDEISRNHFVSKYTDQTLYDTITLYGENYTTPDTLQYSALPVYRTDISIIPQSNYQHWYVVFRCYDVNLTPLFNPYDDVPEHLKSTYYIDVESTPIDTQYGIITEMKITLLDAEIRNVAGKYEVWGGARNYGAVPHLCGYYKIGVAFKREGTACGDWELAAYKESNMTYQYSYPNRIYAYGLANTILTPQLKAYSIGSIIKREVTQNISRIIL